MSVYIHPIFFTCLVAELLKHSPDDFLNALPLVVREVLTSGNVPSSWQRTFFKMLPKTKAAKSVSDFRPIANVRLLYKLFAYLMLGRMEDALEASQPEEQHGFRQGRRIEEHLLTANVCLQKTLAANTPLWIISLDLSKTFDKVDWNGLWTRAATDMSLDTQWTAVTFRATFFGPPGQLNNPSGA